MASRCPRHKIILHPFLNGGQYLDKRPIILWLFKDVLPVNASQHNMINASSTLYSSNSWHGNYVIIFSIKRNTFLVYCLRNQTVPMIPVIP